MKKSLLLLALIFLFPVKNFSQSYCIPTGQGNDGDILGFFLIWFGDYYEDIWTPGDSAYEDVTQNIVHMYSGAEQDFSLVSRCTFSAIPIINIFIDYNGDGDFDDDGEWAVVNQQTISGDLFGRRVDIPADVTHSPTRVRIVVTVADLTSPCGDMGRCNVRDYAVQFSPIYCTPTGMGDIFGQQVFMSYVNFGDFSNFPEPSPDAYQDFTGVFLKNVIPGMSFNIDIYSQNDFSWTSSLNIFIDYNGDGDFDDDHEWVVNNALVYNNESYGYLIDVPNEAVPGISRVRLIFSKEEITSSCGDMGHSDIEDYAINFLSNAPSYCIPTGTGNTDGGHVTNLDFGLESFNFFPTESADSYQDYTNISVDLWPGASQIFMSPKDDISGTPIVNVFVDINRDGDFDDEEEWVIVNSPASNTILYANTLDIHTNNMSVGKSRIRLVVSTADISSSCGDLGRCNIQDYTINFPVQPWYADNDNDGFGDPNNSTLADASPSGFVANNRDCDDSNENIYPGTVPLNISVGDITTSTAMVSWEEGCATKWRTRKSKLGENNWQYAVITSNNRKLVGMEKGAEYEVQVRAFDSDSSDWSESQLFTTLTTCNNVSGLSSTNVTATSAKLKWVNGSLSSKRIHYRPVGSGTWTMVQRGPNAVKYLLNGLTPNTEYEWQVRTMCTTTDFTTWCAMQNFTTASVTRMEDNIDEENSFVNIYPNPGKEMFNVSAEFATDETVDLVVTDILGKEILREKKNMTEGKNNFSLDLRANAPGIYFLKIFSPEGVTTHKMVKE